MMTSSSDVKEGGEQGLATVRTATNSGKEFGSTKDIDVLNRVDEALGKSNERILLHRTCYAQYTDKTVSKSTSRKMHQKC